MLSHFGSFQGHNLFECQLRSESGVIVKVINFGAIIRDWQVPTPHGHLRSVVLGFDRFEDYAEHSPFFGAIVGRVANRIGRARFNVDGKEFVLAPNEGQNQLHGGTETFARKVWKMEPIYDQSTPNSDFANPCAVRLSLESRDGEGAFPGNLRVTVTYRLTANKLRMDIEATSDLPCPVNIVQHNYFNLAGRGDIRDHSLQLMADRFTPTSPGQIPTGEIFAVSGTELDFREEKKLRDKDGRPMELDHNFVLNTRKETEDDDQQKIAAVLRAPDNSLTLTLRTNQRGLQVYTSKSLSVPVPGLHGQRYAKFGAICLEDQNFPDAVNHQNFPNSILRPGETYKHWAEIEII